MNGPTSKLKTTMLRNLGIVGGALLLPAIVVVALTTRSTMQRPVVREVREVQAPPLPSSAADPNRTAFRRARSVKATSTVRPATFFNAPKEPLPDYAALEARWSHEKEDRDWTINAATNIRAIFEATDTDASVVPQFTTRCGETVCRVDFDGQHMSSLVKLASAADHSAVRYQSVRSDGGYLVRAYFVHEAAAPPPMPAE